MSSERAKFEYENENELIEDYKKNINNQANLNIAVEYLYETLVEETIMGHAFQCHFESKHPVSFDVIFIHEIFVNKKSPLCSCSTKCQEVFTMGSPTHSEEKKYSSSSQNDYGSSGNKPGLNCKCMNCEKTISVSKFASHLEVSDLVEWNIEINFHECQFHLQNCMGLGRNSSRLRLASKKTTNSNYYDPESEDDRESDANWSAKEKQTKKKNSQGSNGRNGKNKNKNYM